MHMWFLIILFNSDPTAKVAIYPTEHLCKIDMKIAIKELKGSRDIKSISCEPGDLSQDHEHEHSNKDEWM